MYWLVVPIMFWLIAVLIIYSPNAIYRLLEKEKKKLAEHAKKAKPNDSGEGVLYTIEERALDMISWWGMTFSMTILGLVLIALGFVSLSFIIHYYYPI